MSFESLPTEVLEKIFSYCRGHAQLLAISQVCHRWDDAVRNQLLSRTCLNVFAVVRQPEPSRQQKTKLIPRETLRTSTRKYSCLQVDLCNGAPDRIKKILNRHLDVCGKRFQIERFYLRGSPNWSLVQLFNGRQTWFLNLTFLQVELYPAESSGGALGGMITFPNLKQLVWVEGDQNYGDWLATKRNAQQGWHAFALDAPKLTCASIEMDEAKMRNLLKSRRQDLGVCCLFLPSLELKVGPHLRELLISGVFNLKQRYIDDSVQVLHNLEDLILSECSCDVIVRISDKCPNLKKLTIYNPLEGSMPLQISPIVSANLEKLSIIAQDSSFELYESAVFSKLQHLFLFQLEFEAGRNVSLDAPQLASIELYSSCFRQSILLHTAQVRSMQLDVCGRNNDQLRPLPNVTDLTLHVPLFYAEESMWIEQHLECVPHLTRLKLRFEGRSTKIGLAFVKSLPQLEHLVVRGASIRLIDCEKLAGLKTLLLTETTIETDPRDETVALTALDSVRIDQVTIGGIDRISTAFPIRCNDRQPPIDMVGFTVTGLNVFSSRNFAATLDKFDLLLAK